MCRSVDKAENFKFTVGNGSRLAKVGDDHIDF